MVIIICHYRNEKQLEPKGIPKSFLGTLLQGRHHSTIVFPVPSNSLRSLCEVNSAQFPNAEK